MKNWLCDHRGEIWVFVIGWALYSYAWVSNGENWLIAFLFAGCLMSCLYLLCALMGWWGIEMMNLNSIDKRIKKEYPEFESKYIWKESW